MIHKKLPISITYINENMINQRIDNFLKKQFKNIPKNFIYRIIRTGQVRINKKRIKPHYKLKIGDQLRIPPIQLLTKKKNNNILINNQEKILLNSILYEDNYLLIVNKPSGIAVHGGSGINFGIIELFRKMKPLEKYLELVHRIDRETSGILILSKKRTILTSLHQQIRERTIKKEYIALVHGLWPSNLKKISQPLLIKKTKNIQKKVVIHDSGKFSETYFKIKKKYSFTTLMSIMPKTGRTHQIRVHALYAGHPILFDQRYGRNDLDKKTFHPKKINRLLLHANLISFIHPKTKQKITIQAPLDLNFKNYLNTLV